MPEHDNSQLVNVLIYEHSVRMQKAMFHAKRYHNQVAYLQVYILIVLGMVSTLFSKYGISELLERGFQDHPDKTYTTLLPFAFVLIPTISFFIISNFMDALYNMNAHYAGVKYIENRINAVVGNDIMKWEMVVTPFIYSRTLYMDGIIVKPFYMLGVWAFIAYLCVMIPTTYLCFRMIGGVFSWTFCGAAIFLSIYHLIVWAHTALKWKQQVLDVLN